MSQKHPKKSLRKFEPGKEFLPICRMIQQVIKDLSVEDAKRVIRLTMAYCNSEIMIKDKEVEDGRRR